jgi:anti-sigma factor RsiW
VTCREFADFIMQYLDRELQPESQAAFEQHLAICPNCEEYLRHYRETIAAGRAAFAEDDAAVPSEVPGELIAAILAARRP